MTDNKELHFVKKNFRLHIVRATDKEDALDQIDYEHSDVINWKGGESSIREEVEEEGEISL